MATPAGLVYSQDPRLVIDTDGEKWVVKGPNPIVVSAELLGYSLAALTGLPTPDFAAVTASETDGSRYAGSRYVEHRSLPDALLAAGLVEAPMVLAECLAFDVWTCNTDRNEGNIVGRSVGGHGEAKVELLAIDFESAKLLRGHSVLELTGTKPSDYLPGESIRRHLKSIPPARALCERIASLAEGEIRGVVGQVEKAMGHDLPDAERIVFGLTSRAPKVASLVAEAMKHV